MRIYSIQKLSFFLLPFPEQLVHHLDRTQIPAHRAGLRLPIPLMDPPGIVPIQSKTELLVPVELVPGLRHLYLALLLNPGYITSTKDI